MVSRAFPSPDVHMRNDWFLISVYVSCWIRSWLWWPTEYARICQMYILARYCINYLYRLMHTRATYCGGWLILPMYWPLAASTVSRTPCADGWPEYSLMRQCFDRSPFWTFANASCHAGTLCPCETMPGRLSLKTDCVRCISTTDLVTLNERSRDHPLER